VRGVVLSAANRTDMQLADAPRESVGGPRPRSAAGHPPQLGRDSGGDDDATRQAAEARG
jgi:hypothetical protein